MAKLSKLERLRLEKRSNSWHNGRDIHVLDGASSTNIDVLQRKVAWGLDGNGRGLGG